MEENQTTIKKIITTIDNEKSYSIDVDETTTFYEFKKILAAAAHLLKNCFRIYHEQQEYTNDYDDNTIQELFPDLDPIPLRIISNKDVYEYEDELISVRFNINVPCQIHIGKYKMLYCFTCNKSICMDCFTEDHRNHQVEEKADYLAPAQLLMNNIFSNSALFRADTRLSKYMECVNFRSNLKLNIFDNLRKMINDLEIKFASCLEYFSTSEDETEKNTNENLELLRKYCIECFIKLKNDINTKGIIIDDEIFLTLYRKLKEIEVYKNEYFEENKQKYEKLNTLLAPFIQQVEKISEELKLNFETLLNKDIYEKFKTLVQENIVEKIQKETVNDFMFRNLGVPRKSLNRMSLGNLSAYKTKGNNIFSPNKNTNKIESSPFPMAANLSGKGKESSSGRIIGMGNISGNKTEVNKNTTRTWQKNQEQNVRVKGTDITSEKNDLVMKENMKTNALGNRVITSTTTTTMNNITSGANITGVSSNNLGEQNINQKTTVYKTTTTESVYPGQTTQIYSTQTDFIPGSTIQGQNVVTKTTTTTSNINGTNFSQGYEMGSNSITSQNQKISSTQQISNNNPFGGKLVDILSQEIGKKKHEYEQEKGNTDNTALFGTNSEIIQNVTTTTVTQNISNNFTLEGMENKGPFLFMFPSFNSNSIIGSFADESTCRIAVDFKQAFGEKDIQLKVFPQGGAFCNQGKYLYFTGGQENQKGIGKLFLRLTINFETDKKVKLAKMPSMLFSHFNHSMIANENYIFAIGGYNSNKCEAFNLNTLKWEEMPDLNSPERQRTILVIYGNYLYAFMGYTQFGILDSVERINIKRLGLSKWEKLKISNPDKINLRFYGTGVYLLNGMLYFIGGKIGLGNESSDYKSEIYCFNFDKLEFILTDIYFTGNLVFIENKFHHCSDDIAGNFVDNEGGVLATMPLDALQQMQKNDKK